MTALRVNVRDQSIVFEVRVAPRARRSAVLGTHGDALKVSLAAPPVDGRANEALVELLAELLGVPKRSVSILRGIASRDKTVAVVGVTAERVLALVDG